MAMHSAITSARSRAPTDSLLRTRASPGEKVRTVEVGMIADDSRPYGCCRDDMIPRGG